ncbi:MAG: DUF354 domain-containing protein [Methanosarcina sp.]|jgi:predicted glycosyltransferase|nr:DUF354 domain-containing protein [Methanosarcina sp.]MDD4401613.1 DUF354 domain-containing protein [Desulfitobacteriaceae bacterium]
MKFLIDVGHPAHVHYFRNTAFALINKGHNVIFSARHKEVTTNLLDYYGFQYLIIGKQKKGKIRKIIELLLSTFRLLIVCIREKPDVYLNASPSSAFISWLLRKRHISLEDTFNMEQVRLYLPFTDIILTGDYPHKSLGKKEVQYPGYQELAYLHPNVYTPNPSVLRKLGLEKGEKYAVLRFVAWNASHDSGHKGMSPECKLQLVSRLKGKLKVFITSEAPLPQSLVPFQLHIDPYEMHDVLAFAHLFIGESATMASECACLGVPAIYIHDNDIRYTEEQEKKYGLVFNFSEEESKQEALISKALELAEQNSTEEFKNRRDRMLTDKIDVSAFYLWFFINYPDSEKASRNHMDWNSFRSHA